MRCWNLKYRRTRRVAQMHEPVLAMTWILLFGHIRSLRLIKHLTKNILKFRFLEKVSCYVVVLKKLYLEHRPKFGSKFGWVLKYYCKNKIEKFNIHVMQMLKSYDRVQKCGLARAGWAYHIYERHVRHGQTVKNILLSITHTK